MLLPSLVNKTSPSRRRVVLLLSSFNFFYLNCPRSSIPKPRPFLATPGRLQCRSLTRLSVCCLWDEGRRQPDPKEHALPAVPDEFLQGGWGYTAGS